MTAPVPTGPTSAFAARLHAHGAPLVLEEIPLPSPGPDEVLVDLAFAGVNPVDRYGAIGRYSADVPLPRVLGSEAVGTADGRPVLVHGSGVGTTRDGVWATAAVVPRSATLAIPRGVDLVRAATMGVAGATALRTVDELAQVTPDDRVLVLGATGGVGSMIVSLSRSIGATVWGQTGDAGRRGWLTERGVDRTVVVGDPRDLPGAVADLNPTVVFDPLGDGFTVGAIDALALRGRLVLFGTSAGAVTELNLQTLYRKGISVIGYGGLTEPEDRLRAGKLRALDALATGRLQVEVGKVLPLSEINEALSLLEHRQVLGKLVLDLSV